MELETLQYLATSLESSYRQSVADRAEWTTTLAYGGAYVATVGREAAAIRAEAESVSEHLAGPAARLWR